MKDRNKSKTLEQLLRKEYGRRGNPRREEFEQKVLDSIKQDIEAKKQK